ncbi:MAG: hypothetical protein PVH80_03935 [Anaerolineae bacterium]
MGDQFAGCTEYGVELGRVVGRYASGHTDAPAISDIVPDANTNTWHDVIAAAYDGAEKFNRVAFRRVPRR